MKDAIAFAKHFHIKTEIKSKKASSRVFPSKTPLPLHSALYTLSFSLSTPFLKIFQFFSIFSVFFPKIPACSAPARQISSEYYITGRRYAFSIFFDYVLTKLKTRCIITKNEQRRSF